MDAKLFAELYQDIIATTDGERETIHALEKHCDEYLEDEWAEAAYRLVFNHAGTRTKLVKSLVWNYSTQRPRWGAES